MNTGNSTQQPFQTYSFLKYSVYLELIRCEKELKRLPPKEYAKKKNANAVSTSNVNVRCGREPTTTRQKPNSLCIVHLIRRNKSLQNFQKCLKRQFK